MAKRKKSPPVEASTSEPVPTREVLDPIPERKVTYFVEQEHREGNTWNTLHETTNKELAIRLREAEAARRVRIRVVYSDVDPTPVADES